MDRMDAWRVGRRKLAFVGRRELFKSNLTSLFTDAPQDK
jgi:hypothetical protein